MNWLVFLAVLSVAALAVGVLNRDLWGAARLPTWAAFWLGVVGLAVVAGLW